MKYSILIPIYNAEKHLVECLNSIQIQAITDYEVIMVNDGSTDDSEHICRRYCDTDSRFKLINQKNKGPLVARKTGIQSASGMYIMFMDADDFWQPDTLKTVDRLLDEEDPDMLVFNYQKFQDGRVTACTAPFPDRSRFTKETKREYLCGWFRTMQLNSLWDKVIKRKCIDLNAECYRNDRRIILDEDLFQAICYVRNVETIVYTARPLYNYRYSPAGTTYSIKLQNIMDRNLVYQFIYDFIKEEYANDTQVMNLFFQSYQREVQNRTRKFYEIASSGEIQIWNRELKQCELFPKAYPRKGLSVKSRVTKLLVSMNWPMLCKLSANIHTKILWPKNKRSWE